MCFHPSLWYFEALLAFRHRSFAPAVMIHANAAQCIYCSTYGASPIPVVNYQSPEGSKTDLLFLLQHTFCSLLVVILFREFVSYSGMAV